MKDIGKKIGVAASVALNALHDTENSVLSADSSISDNIQHEVKVSRNSVAQDLINGELTQEVEELRYRTYEVERQSMDFEYLSPTIAKRRKRNKDADRHVVFENSEDLPLVTVIENNVITRSVKDEINDLSQYRYNEERPIKIERNNIPRFQFEKYVTRLFVKDVDDEHVILDFYIPMYEQPKKLVHNSFLREMKRIVETGCKTDLFDIDTVAFTTNKSYKLPDLLDFKFHKIKYQKTVVYDGCYVVKFHAKYLINAYDIMDEMYSESMAKKYEENAPKEAHPIVIGGSVNDKIYVCENCGKQVVYNEAMMNELPCTNESLETDALEYIDMQLIEQQCGRMLCKDCYTKLYIDQTPEKS